MSLGSILPTPHSMRNYYRYLGSFTTPPCTEGVVWSIFQEKIRISHRQVNWGGKRNELNLFITKIIIYFKLKVFHKLKLKKNFRDPQPLNGRRLTSSFTP